MQTDNTNIVGKVVVITGASSALGEATARHLAESALEIYDPVYTSRKVDTSALRATGPRFPVPVSDAARAKTVTDERVAPEPVSACEQIPFEPAFALVLAEHFHHAAVRRDALVGGKPCAVRGISSGRLSNHRRPLQN